MGALAFDALKQSLGRDRPGMSFDDVAGTFDLLAVSATDPLSRIVHLRCAKNMVDEAGRILDFYSTMGTSFRKGPRITLEEHPLVPPGYIVGFTARHELVLLIGPQETSK